MRLVVGVVVAAALAAPVAAQDFDPVRVEKRVGRLESEMRAVQRKVFPGGDPRYFEPEIAPQPAAPPPQVGTPATSPIADLSARLGELERQLREMTGQVEANQFKMRQLEEAQARLRSDAEFRLNALEGGAAAGAPANVPAATPAAVPLPNAPKPGALKPGALKPGAPKPGAPKLATAKPDGPVPGAKTAPDDAPARPATADAAWKAAYAPALDKDWPATEAAMTDFIAAFPKSPRLPQAQYWLGRSFAARDQHAQAAKAFLQLYQTAPLSPRGPDSLVGLATAMNGLKKPKDACRVLGELDSVYGPKLTPGQQADAKALRSRAKCPG